MRLSMRRPVRLVATGYIELFRSIPLLLLIYAFLLALPRYGVNLPVFWKLVVPIVLVMSAVIAEVFRAGIRALDRGQSEAAEAIGFRYWQSMRLVILPQAIRLVLPSLIAQLVTVLKESTLGYAVSYPELMHQGDFLTARTHLLFQTFVIVAVIYVVINFLLGRLAGWVERRLSRRPGGPGPRTNQDSQLGERSRRRAGADGLTGPRAADHRNPTNHEGPERTCADCSASSPAPPLPSPTPCPATSSRSLRFPRSTATAGAWPTGTPTTTLVMAKAPEAARGSEKFWTAAKAASTDAAVLHLRKASEGMVPDETNTHPFVAGSVAFAHNGFFSPRRGSRPNAAARWPAAAGRHRQRAVLRDGAGRDARRGPGPGAAVDGRADQGSCSDQLVSLNALLLTQQALYAFAYWDETAPPRPEAGTATYELMFRVGEDAVTVASDGWEPLGPRWERISNGMVLEVSRQDLRVMVHRS